MSELYFIPKTGALRLSNGGTFIAVHGVRTIPDMVANDVAATKFGIKPVHEMTAAERAKYNMPEPLPDVTEPVETEQHPPETMNGAPVLQTEEIKVNA